MSPAEPDWEQTMKISTTAAGAIALGLVSLAPSGASAAVYAPGVASLSPLSVETLLEPAQYWRGRPRYAPGPYWYHRPWVRRPYYGRIIAGVGLGTIIAVAAAGAVPARPAADLCWYWADPYRTRGYWDYCY